MHIFENNLLGTDYRATEDQFKETLNELSKYPQPNSLRAIMYQRYMKGIAALHLSDDPFEQVTGVSMRKAYLEKYNIVPNTEQRVIVPDLAFIDSDYFTKICRRNLIASIGYEDVQMSTPVGGVIFRSKFTPVKLVSFPGSAKPNWNIKFIPVDYCVRIDHGMKTEIMPVTKGMIIIDAEPLEKLRVSGVFDQVCGYLLQLGQFFNHDMTSHGTLEMRDERRPERIASMLRIESQSEFEAFAIFERNGSIPNSIRQAHVSALEMGALSLHLDICQHACVTHPALERWVAITFCRMCRLLKKLGPLTEDPTCSFFLRFFIYLLSRIMPLGRMRRADFFSKGMSSAQLVFMFHIATFLESNPSDIMMIEGANMSGYPVFSCDKSVSYWATIPRVSHREIYRKIYIDNMEPYEKK